MVYRQNGGGQNGTNKMVWIRSINQSWPHWQYDFFINHTSNL